MSRMETITLDGVTYRIDYTAGTNVVISDGVISVPDVYTKTEVDDLLAALIDGDNLTYGTVAS